MFETYRNNILKYQKLSLDEERHLIAQAKRGDKGKADELILRHIGFVIFRINKIIFPIYRDRFSADPDRSNDAFIYEALNNLT